MSKIGQQVRMLGVEQAALAGGVQPLCELLQIAPVALQRVAREPIFQPQAIHKFVEQRILG